MLAGGGMLACLVVVCLLAVPARGAGGAGDEVGPAPNGLIDQAGDVQRRREQARATVEAGRKREESQTAFVGESADEALQTARSAFGDVVLAPAWRPLELRAREHVDHFLSDFSALLARDGDGHKTLVESTSPLRSSDGAGQKRATDLSLEDRGEGWSPQTSSVAVTIPKRLGDGVALSDVGVSILPAGGGGPGVRVANGVFFANSLGPDSDLLVQPIAGGAELWAQLRGRSSPEDLSFRVGMPARGRLIVDPAGSGAVFVMRDQKRLAAIAPAHAADADGEPVTVGSYEVAGDTVAFHVSHRGADVHYPLLVDPPVLEDYTWGAGADFAGWITQDHSAGRIAYLAGSSWAGSGLYVYAGGAQNYNSTDWGVWYLAPSGGADAFFSRAYYSGVRNDSPESHSCGFGGLYSGVSGWEWGSWSSCTTFAPTTKTQCVTSACDDSTAPPYNPNGRHRNVLEIGSKFNANFYSTSWDTVVTGATVYESQVTAPTTNALQLTYGAGINGWVDQTNVNARVTATDTGMGIKSYQASAPGLSARTRTDSCTGDRHSPCPYYTSWYPYGGPGGSTGSSDGSRVSGDSFALNTADMPTGIDTLLGHATNVVGYQSGDATATVKVDHAAPLISPSGSLYAARGQTIRPGNYTLNVTAIDGANDTNPAHAESGVASLTTYVDGIQMPAAMTYGGSVSGPTTQTCPTNSCSMSETVDFLSVAFLPGPHTIEIESTDQLGHATVQSFPVTTTDEPSLGLASVSGGVSSGADLTGSLALPAMAGLGL